MDRSRRSRYRKKSKKNKDGSPYGHLFPQWAHTSQLLDLHQLLKVCDFFEWVNPSPFSWVKRHEKYWLSMRRSSKIMTYNLGVTKHSNQPYKRFLCKSCSCVAELPKPCFLSAYRARYANCSGYPQVRTSIHWKHNKMCFFRDYQGNSLKSLDLQEPSINLSKVVLKPAFSVGL